MNINKEIAGFNDELIELRRNFHRHPELGLQEFRTAEKIIAYLNNCGVEVDKKRYNQTGVVGLIHGGQPGPTLMLRADMDALAVQEQTDVPFRSKTPGKMHACGHDGHLAMLLVAAKILNRCKHHLKGNVKLVFQPNEEAVGALEMIKASVLENPRVDACMGLHLWVPLETGKMGISAGPVMGGMDHFRLRLVGKGGHTGNPQEGVDPINTAAHIITAVQSLQTREINALKPTTLMFGTVNGGTADNIIAETVELTGTLRYLYESDGESEENPRGRFERIVTSVCDAFRTDIDLMWEHHQPALVNDPGMAEMASTVAVRILNKSDAIVSYVTMAGDDFAEFSKQIPGVFCFIGCGNRQKQATFPHHHPRFTIDEDALALGVKMHVRFALKFLGYENPL